MQNNLYLVCPLGFSEYFIQRKYGTHHYFLTALGSVFRFDELPFIEKLVDFFVCDPVDQITIVHDLNCPLKRKVINHSKTSTSFSEKQLFDLYIDHYYQINRFDSEKEKVRQLALIHIDSLSHQIAHHSLLQGLIREEGIKINGLLVDPLIDHAQFINPAVPASDNAVYSAV
ncbi:hypothetical protein [Cyclobacterium jeungdonense]|uniref:Uncharacterized protein n=1 Tax=Cyclobacterium jeungdonense TaxID=708087 RepID=A0ABT8CBG6_9BACT|nr:hypothetical protein [Cyclobacterium jeungdonense]MDN3688933.1 hypothetical protein [Cyclobacterium jeungdonense]